MAILSATRKKVCVEVYFIEQILATNKFNKMWELLMMAFHQYNDLKQLKIIIETKILYKCYLAIFFIYL